MEIWRDIPGFEGRYQASDLGRVRSVDRPVPSRGGYRQLRGRVLKPQLHSAGYMQVSIARATHIIGPLVLRAFGFPCPSPSHDHAHGDGDKRNNSLDNLRWATKLDNAHDRRLHGTSGAGERNTQAKLTREQVVSILADTRSQRRIAECYGICQPTVSKIKRGDRWAHA